MPKQVIEEYDDELERELTDEEMELLEIDKEQSIKVSKGQVEFKIVNHSERAEKLGRVSDKDTTKYVNVALEYFGHRCALSGEKFEVFDKKVDGKKTNLSAEHVVALCLGGDDIVPNIVPTVLQYNLRKNGYYILDYWNKQKDTEGKSLYSPYRLLKLVNYMMKSIDARKQRIKDIKQYKKVILTPNEIDEFLAEIEKQDEQEPDNTKKKLHSDTITATTIDEDNKKILTQVPQVEGNIPTQREQQEQTRANEIEMMDIFLTDAVSLLKREQDLQQIQLRDKEGNEIPLQARLDQMLETAIGVIPFEVKVRNTILEKLEAIGIRENKYSVANDLLKNTEILSLARENQEEVNKIVEDYIEKQLTKIREEQILREEQLKTTIANMPSILYNEKEMSKIKLWSTYRKNSFEELISGEYTATDNFIDAIIILKKNGINVIYTDEKGKIKNTIKATDTIETMLENYYPKLTEEKKDQIREELEALGINKNIGKSLSCQKRKSNIEKFKQTVLELQEELKQEGIEISQDEIHALIDRQISQDSTKDMINTIEVLKRNGISLVYTDEDGKIVNTIKRTDTIETMLENYYPKLTGEKKDQIREELEALGINENIGDSLSHQKNRKDKEKFKQAVLELQEELKQEGIEISQDEINALIDRQRSQDPTKDMINAIMVLKKNGVNLVYTNEKGKIKKTIKTTDTFTIETMLENYYPKLKEEKKEQIKKELEALGINENIGESLSNQKNRKDKEKFKQAVLELQEELKQEGIEISQDEINALIDRQRSQDSTKDMIDAIEVLKRNGISLVYADEKGKIKNTIKYADTIETMLENYCPKLTEEKKEKIRNELETLGINKNIGTSLDSQKKGNKRKKFEQAIQELQEKLKQEGIELNQEEINSLIPSRTAQDIGKASYDASTVGCDEKQEFMQGLERTIKERGRAS